MDHHRLVTMCRYRECSSNSKDSIRVFRRFSKSKLAMTNRLNFTSWFSSWLPVSGSCAGAPQYVPHWSIYTGVRSACALPKPDVLVRSVRVLRMRTVNDTILTTPSLVPSPLSVFHCCTMKNGRAWEAKSRACDCAIYGLYDSVQSDCAIARTWLHLPGQAQKR